MDERNAATVRLMKLFVNMILDIIIDLEFKDEGDYQYHRDELLRLLSQINDVV